MSVAEWSQKLSVLSKGLPQCSADLPPAKSRDIAIEGVSDVPHAPKRNPNLTSDEFRQAVKNVLRYFPQELHATLAPEFAAELKEYGHIYCYRLLPEFLLKAAPVEAFPAKTQQARCIMHMICNNLSNEVAQFPRELITYGGNGSVFNNWAQFWLVMQYLSEMTQEQTLVMNSGHPQGLYPSHADAPRCVLTNGMVVPNWSTLPDYERMYAMCNTMYGQMTAGSWCYIGPQGIVHGTTLTLLNGARKYLDLEDMSGVCYVSSGLGGMSGAQGKAAVICGAVTIIAEVDPAAMHKRHEQGWVQRWSSNLDEVIQWAIDAKKSKQALSIAYLGNVVDLWERLVEEAKKGNKVADLGSDQTSLHNPYGGGYYPVQLSFEESQRCMVEEPERFKQLVQESLRRQFAAINALSDEHGLKWWDYGNSALLEASRAGAAVENTDENNKLQVFKYPSYVEDIMGDIFALGFGPFRWVCCSGSAEDLRKTDEIAAEVMRRHIAHLEKENTPVNERTLAQYRDNLLWIEKAEENQLVVGSQARILYSGAVGRRDIALAFNDAVKSGALSGPVVLSRDHHDVSGTDSPFRETSDMKDGSRFTADMAVQNFAGDSFRGATWVALHNGGGCGWGNVINGGFGLVLDGSDDAARRAANMLFWDVNNGISRRSWGGNHNARLAIEEAMRHEPKLKVTLPHRADDALLESLCALD